MVPQFLKNLDRYLLLRYPVLWISRVHYMLPVLILLSAFFYLISAILPIDVRHDIDIEYWWLVFVILAVVLMCFWVYHSVIFNVEKLYGSRSILDEYKLFFLYALVFCGLIVYSWPFFMHYSHRIAKICPDEELFDDINKLNLGHAYFLEDSYQYEETIDTVEIRSPFTGTDSFYIYQYVLPAYYRNFDKYTPHELWDSSQFPQIIRPWTMEHMKKPDETEKLNRIRDYLSVFRKYKVKAEISPEYVYSNYNAVEDSMIRQDLFWDHRIVGVEYYMMHNVVSNIADAKFDTPGFLTAEGLWVETYLAFYFTLAFLMFRNVNWKHFIVSIVSMFSLFIILLILVNVLPYSFGQDEDILLYTWMMIYITAVIIVLIMRATSHKFHAYVSVLLQFIFLASPLLFIGCMIWLDDVFDIFGRHYYQSLTDQYYNGVMHDTYWMEYERRTRQFHEAVQWSAIGGLVFQAILVLPLVKEEFVRMYSIPRNK